MIFLLSRLSYLVIVFLPLSFLLANPGDLPLWYFIYTIGRFCIFGSNSIFSYILIQLWDIRKPDNCIQPFVAHIGPVFSIEWHSEEPDWLGTAGRDKLIKVGCQLK